jgi:hypothetical protein
MHHVGLSIAQWAGFEDKDKSKSKSKDSTGTLHKSRSEDHNMEVEAGKNSEHEDTGKIEVEYDAEGAEPDKEMDAKENAKLMSLAVGTDKGSLFEGEETMEDEAMHQEVEGFVDVDKEGHGLGDELEEGQSEAKEVEDDSETYEDNGNLYGAL